MLQLAYMPRLAKPTWERFAACYALTGNAAESYRQCGAKGKQGPDAGKRGLEYRNKPEVARRIKELRGEIATAAARKFALSRDDVLAWLTTAFQIPIGAIDANSPYCQHYSQVRTARRTTTRIVAIDRIKAVALLGRLCDWEDKESPALAVAPQQTAPADLDAAVAELFAIMAESSVGSTSAPRGAGGASPRKGGDKLAIPRQFSRDRLLCARGRKWVSTRRRNSLPNILAQ